MIGALFPATRERLEATGAEGRTIAFWWRDDDARRPGESLARLLALRRQAGVPMALAVIPDGVEAELAEALGDGEAVRVLLHGWCHRNHAPQGQKRAEFGDHRPIGLMLDEAASGRAALSSLFADRFLPVFVPPWNRIGPGFRARLSDLDLPGLSTFGRAAPAEPHRLNTHLDLMNWREARGLTPAEADRLLAAEIDHRLNSGGESEPIGLLSHHLQHDDAAWALLEALLEFLVSRVHICWPPVPMLFGLLPVAAEGGAGTRPEPGTPLFPRSVPPEAAAREAKGR